MGLQITVLLADVIYVEMLQSTVPVFDKYQDTPNILFFFVVSISLLCICLLISTYTMFLYHCPEYEARNFTRTEARISRGIAKFFTAMACGHWNIDVPENTNNIARKKEIQIDDKDAQMGATKLIEHEKIYEIEDLQLGLKFYADMINKLAFFIISILYVITFFFTFVHMWIRY